MPKPSGKLHVPKPDLQSCRCILLCYLASVLHAHSNSFPDSLLVTLLQLKNMIAALYHSKEGRTNNFERKGILFGWTVIEDMLRREVERQKKNQLPRVPGLKPSYVYRDAWTRLNVKPAKLMQVCGIQCVCQLCHNYYSMSNH